MKKTLFTLCIWGIALCGFSQQDSPENRSKPGKVVPVRPGGTEPRNPNSSLRVMIAPWKQGQKTVSFNSSKLTRRVKPDGTIFDENLDLPSGLYIVVIVDENNNKGNLRKMNTSVSYSIPGKKSGGDCFKYETLPSDQNCLEKMDVEDPPLLCIDFLVAHNYSGDLSKIPLNIQKVTSSKSSPIKIIVDNYAIKEQGVK